MIFKNFKKMNSKTLKTVHTIIALFVVAFIVSSCNRGGSGCPYEMQIATDVLMNIVK